MKDRLMLLWLMTIMCIPAMAQTAKIEYRPFAENGKVWKAQVGGIKENLYGNRIDGDTLIYGESWMKVYNYVGFPDFGCSYYASIRDVGNKVYAIAKGSKKPRLLYDFSLKKGDVVKCGVEGNAFGCLLDKNEQPDTLLGFPFVAYLRVENVDTIKARGLLHRRFTLTMLDAYREFFRSEDGVLISNIVWIEGIGSGAGPFSPWMALPPRDSYLQSCELNKVCLFGYPDFYENYAMGDVSSTRSISSPPVVPYDLQGRRLTDKPASGVYIENGKKRVVK